jgi:hypothetical protein
MYTEEIIERQLPRIKRKTTGNLIKRTNCLRKED